MQFCDLQISPEKYEVHSKDIAELVQKHFPKPADAVIFIEGNKSARLLPLPSFTFPQNMEQIFRLIVSSKTCEVRLEKKGCEDKFYCRIISETSGETYAYREDKLILRKTQHIDPTIFANGRGRMRHREYFQQDEYGAYVFFADRLAGSSIQ